ncbi:MAG: protein kinase, partial [Propionibacteriaceae bacterium]|nr:protein kinase [Propionibacteriaceae bacterium]
MSCGRPGCPGRIIDGYCDVCGLPPVGSDGSGAGPSVAPSPGPGRPLNHPTPTPAPVAPPSPRLSPGRQAMGPTPYRPAGPTPPAGPVGPPPTAVRCQAPGCPGLVEDGYCTICGAPAGPPPPARPSSAVLAAPLTSRLGTTALGSARLRVGAGPVSVSRAATSTRLRSGHLGAGLTEVPVEPAGDPAATILTDPAIPEERRVCPSCGAAVGRSDETGEGRLEGFCPQCRQPYSFTPKLTVGELVAGQYEVRGPLAYGGMGWIYLAQDRNVSNRWVVLKGLLNVGDANAQASAIAEQRFLAEVQHPLIVEIFNFVTHRNAAYIVMEFVNGRSVKQILKDRRSAAGTHDPLPVDQAIALILGVLPAFNYLHQRGLLYCDFKPDNLMHLDDTVKLIDLGGVRRIDDDVSPIFGTAGFQAPEVPTQGCSSASDIYTIGRTLLVCCAEVKGYQTTYQTTLPPVEELPSLARHDSLYRLIARACAPSPSDRFSSIDELRVQLLGVLREAVGVERGSVATSSAVSELFEHPTVASDSFDWSHLPRLKPDPTDPAVDWLASLAPLPPTQRVAALGRPPVNSPEVELARCWVGLELGDAAFVDQRVEAMLSVDPWEWRAAWMAGVSLLQQSQWNQAQSYFNAVLGQVPGELAPKFALAVACEVGGQPDLAESLYGVCAATDTSYLTAAGFGLARVRARRRSPDGQLTDLASVLSALDLIPATARGYLEARRLAATYLVTYGQGLPALELALAACQAAKLDPVAQAK